jgi:N-methylhydantoinase A/oxoprolinase/acetone carboxylase beta subunit
MADVKVSALTTLASMAEADVVVVNDDDAVGEKVKKATTAVLRTAILLPGVDNTNDIGSATKQVKDVYIKGTVTINAIPQGKDITAALHRKIVNIGDWNMDSTNILDVSHGLTLSKIRSVSGVVRDDSDGVYSPIGIANYTTGVVELSFGASITSTVIRLQRLVGGQFDGVQYDSTSFNRGWLVIDYVD